MPRVEIVYFSAMGHTEGIARSVQRGLETVPCVVSGMIPVSGLGEPGDDDDPGWARLDAADAIVLGSPTYMGGVAAEFKGFFDRTGSRWFQRRWMDKLAAGFTVGGGLSGDKQSALQAMHVFACQHGMVWVSMGVGVAEPGLDRLSSSIGLMCQADNVPPADSPPKEDHATAQAFGGRIGHAAVRWGAGGDGG